MPHIQFCRSVSSNSSVTLTISKWSSSMISLSFHISIRALASSDPIETSTLPSQYSLSRSLKSSQRKLLRSSLLLTLAISLNFTNSLKNGCGYNVTSSYVSQKALLPAKLSNWPVTSSAWLKKSFLNKGLMRAPGRGDKGTSIDLSLR